MSDPHVMRCGDNNATDTTDPQHARWPPSHARNARTSLAKRETRVGRRRDEEDKEPICGDLPRRGALTEAPGRWCGAVATRGERARLQGPRHARIQLEAAEQVLEPAVAAASVRSPCFPSNECHLK